LKSVYVYLNYLFFIPVKKKGGEVGTACGNIQSATGMYSSLNKTAVDTIYIEKVAYTCIQRQIPGQFFIQGEICQVKTILL